MLLKATVLTVLLVGLLDQSGAFPKADTTRSTPDLQARTLLPGFHFFRNRFGQVRLFSNEGNLFSYDAMKNLTAWRQVSGSNFKFVQQIISLPVLGISYNKTSAKFGPYKSTGSMDVDISGNTYNLTFNATKLSDNNGCLLSVIVELISPELQLESDFDDLGKPGVLIERNRSISKGIADTVAQSLKGVLEEVIAVLVKKFIYSTTNYGLFCKSLLDSSETKFPELDMNWEPCYPAKNDC